MKTKTRNGIIFLAMASVTASGCEFSAVNLRRLEFRDMSELPQEVACSYLALIQLGPVESVPSNLQVSLRDANMDDYLFYSSEDGGPGTLLDNGFGQIYLAVPRSGATTSIPGPVGLQISSESTVLLDFDEFPFDAAFPVNCGDGFSPAELSLDAAGINLW